MTFATPWLAGIAAAIAIPTLIILYFLKLRRRDMEISTTLLWKKAIQDLQANAPFQKLRRNILLFLQLIALAIILFALAQPEFKDITLSNQRQVILIDCSASMSSLDGGEKGLENLNSDSGAKETRLEEAKRRAIAMVDQMKEPGLFQEKAEEAMVIAFNNSAEVRQAFTSNKTALKAAIEGIEPTDAPSGLERAITLAKAYSGTQKFEDQVQEDKGFVATSPPASIHLFSDGRLPDAERVQTEPTDNVVFHAVGSPEAPNVGITGLRAERAFDNPGKVSIFVGLQNTARQQRTVQVELLLDDTVVKVSEIPVAAASKAVQDAPSSDAGGAGEGGADPAAEEEEWNPGLGGTVYTIERAEGAIARVRLSMREADALTSDNVAYLVIPPARRLAVCLVTAGDFYIKPALDGMNLSRLDVLKPAEYQKLLDNDQLAQYDVAILDRWLPDVKASVPPPPPAPAPGDGTAPAAGSPAPAPPPVAPGGKRPGLPPGRSLVLGVVPPPPLGAVDEGETDTAFFAANSWDHPALRMAELGKVTIVKGRKVRILPETPVRDIATTTVGPGILEITDSDTLALVVVFDHTECDWGFNPGWVLFLAMATQYLSDASIGSAGVGLMGDAVRVGETLSTRLPVGAGSVRIGLPNNDRLSLEPGADNSVAYGPIVKTGIYTVSWEGQGTASDLEADGRVRRPIAANLLSPDESDVAARRRLAMAREVVSAQEQKEVQLTRKLWPWLLLGALGVVMFEWWVYNRKVML
ncbi:MAG: BatA and WFA domain-containing protein [Phycisphaerales bacterium]|nr:BatA and WFA domain-containing protein [Phycisphaerales bacterium]